MPTDINLPVRTPFLMNRLRFDLTLLNGDAVNAEPAKNVSVTVHQLGADGKPAAVLVNGRADAQGRVAFFISDQPPKDPAAQREPLPKIQIIVRDVDGDAIGQSVALQPERGKELPAQKVSLKAHLEKLEAPLDAWTTATGMRLSSEVDQALKSSKIGSLAKLRAAKDIEKTPGLGQADIKELKLLQKHARLQLICRDHKANKHLVDAGISDVTDIARLTRSSFAKKLKGKLDLQKANALYEAAMRAMAVASRLAMANRVDAANNRVAKAQASTAEPQPCACDCQSAVSPLAYLADLLDYAVRHVLFNGAEVSMDQLGEQFFQPFATLPADCSASETQVRQVRLCIEVLRKKAAKEGTDISAIVEAHAQSSYPSLLSALGVTPTDLRLARAASDERKQTLADRMGVPVAQLLDFLVNGSAQTEEKLNELFGLPPTKPDVPAAAEPALQKAKLARLDEIWLAADTAAQPVWIDPDFVSTAFFAVTGSTAETLLEARKTDLGKLYDDIKLAVNTSVANLTEVMKSDQASAVHGMHGLEIGTEAELDEFNSQRQEGRAYTRTVNREIVSLDFGKLSIRKSELDQLLVVRQLASDNSVTSADWEEAHHVLSAIEKRSQLVPKWQAEERAKNIVLSPAVFALPGDMLALLTQLQSNPPWYLRWRLDTRALRDWLTVLEDRIAQRDAALASIQAAADAAEEAHLVALRDALLNAVISEQTDLDPTELKATDSPAEKLEKKRKWVTNYFLISAHESACRKTTRAAQAVECLQLLLWGIHSKLLERDDFSLDADDFESEWKGLGTYKAWRALMWVYLYPENIARPSYIKPTNRTLVLAVYDLLVKHWQLLGVDTTAVPPDGVSLIRWSWAQWVASEVKKGSLLGDSDFMTMSSSSLQEVVTKLGAVGYAFTSINPGGLFTPNYLLELRYFVPLDIAFRLRDEGRPAESIEWLRRAADLSTGRPNDPEAADYLESLRTPGAGVSPDDDWLTSPLPHEAAEHTPGGYERRVLLGAISAYLDMAEADFARDTTESLARAREAYLAALDLLNSPVLGAPSAPCSALKFEIGDEKIREIVIRILVDLFRDSPLRGFDRDQLHVADKAVDQLVKRLRPGSDLVAFRDKVRLAYEKAKPRGAAKTMKSKVGEGADNQARSVKYMLEDQALFGFVQTGWVRNADGDLVKTERIRPPFFSFCIPPNPVIHLLRLRAESGFFKLTHCMNVAGLKRETQPYSAPTDVTSGVAEELIESAPTASTEYFMPPGAIIYRYKALIERARQLVSIAQQVESTYLQFLERRDAEQFTVMQARQGLSLASATVSLQDLRVDEAEHGKDLAQKQSDRAGASFEHFDDLLNDGELWQESAAFWMLAGAAFIQSAGTIVGVIGGGIAVGAASGGTAAAMGSALGALGGAILSGGSGLATMSSALSMSASYERRIQEWEFQKALAEIDQKIAEIQQTLAEDRYQITSQERRISQLSRDHASDVVEFLDSKFTDRELYAWMGGIVGQAYRYFLQQASSMAKLAQRQLAFERQEPELGFILDDYWTHTPTGSLPGSNDQRERRGMTGSVRLLQDITRLDQQAFLTDRRRIPLPKHISLSAHDPVAFMRFRESGVLHIATSLDMFDRDFPGDYLRLVKRIRVAVIALIPPLDGIKATLSSTGISRVVRGGDRFVETTITTQPETVAITAPVSGPGVVELQQEQADMLLPFEGLGVAGNWVLTMPKAANAFDFNTIADVVFTIEYTAIYSDEFRLQVVQRLNADRSFDGERAFSLRHHFADEWYNLHHPELFDDVNRRLRPELSFRRSDYPPNLTDGSLKLSHLTLFVARSEGFNDEIEVSHLSWEPQNVTVLTNANTLTTRNGVLTTRDVPANIWLGAPLKESPVGKLSFKLGSSFAGKPIEQALREGLITDIFIAVAIRADQPLWPL